MKAPGRFFRIPQAPLAFLLLALWLPLYALLPPIWNDGTYYTYGWYVPGLFALLLFRNWSRFEFRAWQIPPALIGILAGLFFLTLRVLEKADPFWRLPLWIHGLGIAIMTLIFVRERNKPWWSLIFLVVFGLSALPSPPVVEQPFVGWLTDRVVATTSFALNSAGIPTRVLGTQMEIGGHLVAVDEACSGIRSLQALGMVALFLGLLFRVRPHVQFGLLGAAFGLSLLFNTFRALGLSWIVFRLGQEGYEQWHDTLGGITFALSSLGLYFLTELSREAPPALKEPRGFVLGPLSWACGLALVLAGGVAEVGSTVWYSWHRRETPAVDWSFRLPDKPRAGYLPEKITDSKAGNVLKFTQGEMGRFQTPQGLRLDVMHLSYAENNSRAWLDLWGYGGHDIDVCMRTLGSQLEAPGPTRILDLGNLRLNVESFRFRHLRNQQIIYVYRIRWTATGDRFDPHSDLREMRLKAVKQGQNNYRSDLIIAGVSGRDLAEPVCYATFCEMIRENLIQRQK